MSRLPASRSSKSSARIVGRTQPRIFTPPLRPLNRRTTRGYEVIDFAEAIGVPLQPWQKWWLVHVLELNPDGTYRFRVVLTLVARQNGKSTVKRVLSLWRLYMDGARTVLGIAQDVGTAREQMGLCKATIAEDPDLYAEWGGDRKVNANEFFWLSDDSLPPGAPVEAHPRYLIRASNKKAGRSLSIDELNIDELREQTDWAAWAAVSKTVMARRYAQIHALSNAGDEDSVVLNQLRDSAIGGRDPLLGIFEWSGEDGCALDDPRAIAQANPGLGYVIQWPSIMSALSTDPPQVYRTEVLCQGVDRLEGAVDGKAWKACADPTLAPPAGRELIACFDMAENGAHATLAVAAIGPDGLVQVAIRHAWKDTETCRAELPEMLAELKPRLFAWYPSGPAAALAAILRPSAKDGRLPGRIPVVELTGGKVGEACQGLADLAKSRSLVHPDDPLINAHVIGAQKQAAADGWRFIRRGAGSVDAAFAVAGAAQVALTQPRRAVQMRVV